MNNYKLFLDDVRMPQMCHDYMKGFMKDTSIYLDNDWVIVRSYKEFCDTINEKGIPTLISFDHDLADIHYDPSTWTEAFKYHEETGYDCAKWLIEKCREEDCPIPNYLVHSMNPVGAENIKKVLYEAIV